jgi:hypothetical protein
MILIFLKLFLYLIVDCIYFKNKYVNFNYYFGFVCHFSFDKKIAFRLRYNLKNVMFVANNSKMYFKIYIVL